MSYNILQTRRKREDNIKRLEAEKKYGKPIMKNWNTGEWVPAHYVGGILFKGRPEKISQGKE